MKTGTSLGDCIVCGKPVIYGTPALIHICPNAGANQMPIHQLCFDADAAEDIQWMREEGLLPAPLLN